MAIDFLKNPPPEEAGKPKHYDFWKPEPPVFTEPAICDEERLRLDEAQLAKEKAEFEAEKNRIEEEEAKLEKPIKKRKG